jgi:hypothetical protein
MPRGMAAERGEEMSEESKKQDPAEVRQENRKLELSEAELGQVTGGGLKEVEGNVSSTWTPRSY